MSFMIATNNLFSMAKHLMSEDNDNPEYDRALSELICEAMGDELELAPEWLAKLQAARDEMLGRKG